MTAAERVSAAAWIHEFLGTGEPIPSMEEIAEIQGDHDATDEQICDLNPHIHSNGYWTKHQARGALEAELVRRAATPEPT